MHAAGGSGLAAVEVEARLAAITQAARVREERVLAPLLILGTSERVGSNWVSDTLRPVLGQHNEPFRQQLGPDHPWSALNPRFGDPRAAAHGGLGRHWLVSFALAKYGPHRQVVKETNLFFALPALLSLLPGAPVLVLSRCPLGVASSFIRGDLFRRWGYRSRYQQMLTMTRSGPDRMRGLAALVPDDEPSDLVALVRLQVLNTVLIAEALAGRRPVHVAYETAVTRPAAALATLTSALPELRDLALAHGVDLARDPGQRRHGSDDTFATTNARTALTVAVPPADAAFISAAKTASLAVASALLPRPVMATAESWLSGDHLYRLEPQHPRARQGSLPVSRAGARPRYLRRGALEVRNLLVSNSEYTRFLNVLAAAGMPNNHDGAWLLACEMPHERGGRLHHDASTGRWTVSPGYQDYPAYWITWIGAAAFAAWTGARLPARTELAALTAGAPAARNAGYREGDASPVTEPGAGRSRIHHLLGNLQPWCSDGPDAASSGRPVTRWLYGIAWNTPATREAAQQPRSRHLLGSSRGVGIRLVRDGQQPVGAAELARRLGRWISALDDRSRPLAEIDQQVIRLLSGSQPDAGLGTHVAASAGEPVHG
jgi:formylglycine-generating enzyme required for sulfatase activity